MDETEMAAGLAPRLELLRALAAEGHVGRAAEIAGLPQPTASRWLAALGEELGLPIIVRHGRGILLTRAGRSLADSAARALTELENGCRRALAEADPAGGHVALGFLHTMGGVRVPELLRAFRRDQPGVGFTLSQGAHEDMLRRVADGSIDLALTSPPPTEPEFESAPLARQPLVLTVHSGHRLAGRRQVRLTEVADEPFVGLKAGYGLRQMTDQLCAAAGFTPLLAFEGEEADTVRGLVAAGLGVAVLPAAEPSLLSGTVELALAPRAHRTIGLVWAAHRPLSPAVRRFRDFAVASRT
jgi:DNA-binding transcriptional LysR family regulator